MKTWIINKRLFDADGEMIGFREVKRFNQDEKPSVKLGKHEALFQCVQSEAYDERLAYPAAHGLSVRKGV